MATGPWVWLRHFSRKSYHMPRAGSSETVHSPRLLWQIALPLLCSCLFAVMRPERVLAQDMGLPMGAGDKKGEEAEDDILGAPDRVFEELAHLARAGSIETRGEALWRLARLDDERSVAPIAGLLPDLEPALRPFVAMGLGWLGAKARSAAGALAELLKDPSPFTITTTVWALGRIGDGRARKRIEPFLGSDNELVSFLAMEAMARLDGNETLPVGPRYRPLRGATILAVLTGDAASARYIFGEPLGAEEVEFRAVSVGPFNPAMRKLGGMPRGEQERFSQLLCFRDGQPQVDLVLVTPIYEHELPVKLRWELWNYVRRGGKLVMTDTVFRKFLGVQSTTRHSDLKIKFEWVPCLFDSVLPEKVGVSDFPFLDGTARKSQTFRYGVKQFGRGSVLVVASPDSEPARLADLFQSRHKTWKHMAFWHFIGNDRAEDPLLWSQMFRWLLEGPGAFSASAVLTKIPALKAGATARVALRVKNYLLDSQQLRAKVALVSVDERQLSEAAIEASVPKGKVKDAVVPLTVPLDAWQEDYRLVTVLSAADGRELRAVSAAAKVTPAFSIKLEGPRELLRAGERLSLTCRVENLCGQTIGRARIVAAIADRDLRPLLRREPDADFGAGETREVSFDFVAPHLTAGLYHWVVQVVRDGRVLGQETTPLARMEPWRFRRELVVAPFGFGPLQPRNEIEGLAAIGMTTYGLPPSFGRWTYQIQSPTFLPRHGWPAEILEGPEGEEWREHGEELRYHPFFTFADTVEESDLQIGSKLFQHGDVEEPGHEQYRIYLRRKYRTLSALNEAWKSDYANWDEIALLGGVTGKDGEVLYTSRIGMTTGQLVPVPKQLDPAKGITSFQPYHDQNAWRWHYVWMLLEIRHTAFHQADPFHPLAPGGAMGLHAPFDAPHFRIYAWNPLSLFSRRVTFGRPTYGTKPHTVLVGVPNDEKALGKLFWQAIAAGGRFLMPYAPGDQYGVRLLNEDYTPTPIGRAAGKLIERIRSRQEVLLATRNAVETRALFLSEGDSGYGSSLSLELYEALLWSGIMIDYGTSLAGRRLVITGSSRLSEATVTALGRFVAEGGVLVILSRTSAALLAEFGLGREEEALPKDFRAEVALDPKGASFHSRYRAEVKVESGDWAVLARYADTQQPAVLSARRGKGDAFYLNLEPAQSSLADRYREGPARQQAEAYRRLVATLAARGGVTGAYQTADEKGRAIPYVQTHLLQADDSSQRYLVAYADNRLPDGMASAAGEMVVKLPGVELVYDVYEGRDVSFRNGRFPFALGAGQGTVFSLLMEDLGGLTVTPEVERFAPGCPLRVRVEVKCRDGKPSTCEHALNVHVFDAEGQEISALRQRLSVRGRGVLELFASWDDPDGDWRIVVDDLTAGLKGEAIVRKADSADPPPHAPSAGFARPAADVTLTTRPLPPLNAFVSFVDIAATLRSTREASLKVKVRLRMPEECLLAGPQEQVVELTRDEPTRDLVWTAFISRENAVGFFYSDKSSGFFTDHFRPEVHRYRGTPMPSIELELPNGRRSFHHIPVTLNQFARAPIPIGKLSSQPVEIRVLNGTQSRVAGKLCIDPHRQWTEVPREYDFDVAPGKMSSVTFAPGLRADASVDPGVYLLPASVRVGGRTFEAGKLRVEHMAQRRWLVRQGDRVATLQGKLPFDSDGNADRSGWRSVVCGSRVTVGDLLPKVGSIAYAATSVTSPKDQPVALVISPPGASVKIWLNGVLVRSSDLEDGQGDEPALGEEGDTDDDFLKEVGSELRKGTNSLIIQFLRTAKRYRDAPLFLRDKKGKNLPGLEFGRFAASDRG